MPIHISVQYTDQPQVVAVRAKSTIIEDLDEIDQIIAEVETPTIDWLIDQIKGGYSPLIEFNVNRLKEAIKREVDKAKSQLFNEIERIADDAPMGYYPYMIVDYITEQRKASETAQ